MCTGLIVAFTVGLGAAAASGIVTDHPAVQHATTVAGFDWDAAPAAPPHRVDPDPVQLVAVTLIRPDPAPLQLTAEAVTDLIWVHSRPEDRVEHIRSRIDLNRYCIAAAIIADTPDAATANLRHACERALHHAPALQGWSLALT
ncbi:hypothetical protein GCM10025734_83180 [Kitasatospora paranensis]|uniref:hypothetical protein n=1 Tax=Kitasatospora paranensis TaxID=258053 RepID=UPI0031ECFAC3